MESQYLKLLTKLTTNLTNNNEQFSLMFSTGEGFLYEFQNINLEHEESHCSDKCLQCKIPCELKTAKQENTSKKNKHSCVANPYSHGQQFVGKTMLDIETEQEKGDLCGKLTRICLELFGRGSYSF